MNTEPITDAFAIKFKTPCGEKYWVPVDIARKMQRELDELKALLTKEQGAVTISRNGYVQELERQLDEARGQRDRLAAALTEITLIGDAMSDRIANEALQSLTTNAESTRAENKP